MRLPFRRHSWRRGASRVLFRSRHARQSLNRITGLRQGTPTNGRRKGEDRAVACSMLNDTRTKSPAEHCSIHLGVAGCLQSPLLGLARAKNGKSRIVGEEVFAHSNSAARSLQFSPARPFKSGAAAGDADGGSAIPSSRARRRRRDGAGPKSCDSGCPDFQPAREAVTSDAPAP